MREGWVLRNRRVILLTFAVFLLVVAVGVFWYLKAQDAAHGIPTLATIIASVYAILASLWSVYGRRLDVPAFVLAAGFISLGMVFLWWNAIAWMVYALVIMALALWLDGGGKKWLLWPVALAGGALFLGLVHADIPRQGGLLAGEIWYSVDTLYKLIRGMPLKTTYYAIAALIMMFWTAFALFPFSWLKRNSVYSLLAPASLLFAYGLLYKPLFYTYYSLPAGFSHLVPLMVFVIGVLFASFFRVDVWYSLYAIIPVFAMGLTVGRIDLEPLFVFAAMVLWVALAFAPLMDYRWGIWHLMGGPVGLSMWGMWLVFVGVYNSGNHLEWWLLAAGYLVWLSEFAVSISDDVSDSLAPSMMEEALRLSDVKKFIIASGPGLVLAVISLFIGVFARWLPVISDGELSDISGGVGGIQLPFAGINTYLSSLILLNIVVVALMWVLIWMTATGAERSDDR